MKAIFFKELTETTVRVLGLMILVSLVLFSAVMELEPTVVGQGMLRVGAFGFSIAAFLIGAIQVLQDWSLDRWSFLTHRPISRSRIFAAKVLAGLCLYFLAAGVPLLVAIVWVATPGLRQLPFNWSMTLPGITLWFHGFLWYFVAILVVTRDARWYGTRLLPIGGALVLSSIAIVLTLNFVEVYLVLAMGFILLIPAAHGGFVSAGNLDRQSVPARGAHILTITVAAMILLACAGGLFDMLVSSWFYQYRGHTAQSYVADSDGRVLLQAWRGGTYPAVSVVDGDPLPAAPAEHAGHPRFYDIHADFLSLHDTRQRTQSRGQMPHWNGATYLLRLQHGANPTWFYLPTEQRIHLVNLQSGRLAGTIGEGGFTQPPARAEPFASPLVARSNSPLAWDDTRVYEIDAERSSLRVVAELEAGNRVLDAISFQNRNGREVSLGTVFVSTTTGIQAWRDGQKLLSALPVETTGEYWGVSITPTRKNTFMLLYNQSYVYGPPPVIAVELSAAGEVLRKIELPLLRYDASPYPAWLGAVYGICMPQVLAVWTMVRTMTTTHRLIGEAPPGMWIFPTTVLVASIVALGLVVVLSRRMLLSRNATIGWSILTLLTGLSGVLTLLAVRGMPWRIKCPGCGKPRVIDRADCEACGAAHAPPSLTGIEIFE